MSASNIRVIGYEEIRCLVGIADILEPVKESLVAYSAGHTSASQIGLLALPDNGEVHIKSGYLKARPYFVTKVATMCPVNRASGRHTSDGLVAVFDAKSGYPVAVLHDRKYLTDIRTAAVGAIAAEYLSRKDSTVLGILGTGGQAFLQTMAVLLVRSITDVVVYGRDRDRTQAFIDRILREVPSLRVRRAKSPQEVTMEVDILVTVTASTDVLVKGAWLNAGLHVTAAGADDEHKQELDFDSIERADLRFVDSKTLCERYGELALYTKTKGVSPPVNGELGELISGKLQGRSSRDQITLSKHVGIGVEDVVAAEAVMKILQRYAELDLG
ncbi:ornithine cyclodeaminase family protein [Undibacterium sp. TS12]|uniref:ornithine cyclodeaminase family protein n=1 Tax=Undibacterium sp. TS12 TaxID=2908202 RepID=UPI001F4CACDD|nr:ornithine cyclodeaminase family protein [Undibacterium sp. TS12]MCH8620251.1 ornithine cyclodeaminase family protein [Undibacterium sp. TS12]